MVNNNSSSSGDGSNNNNNSSSSNNNNTSTIVAISLSSLILVLIITGLLIFVKKRKANSNIRNRDASKSNSLYSEEGDYYYDDDKSSGNNSFGKFKYVGNFKIPSLGQHILSPKKHAQNGTEFLQQRKQQLEDEEGSEESDGIMITKIHSVSIHHEDFTLDDFDNNGTAASFKSSGTGTSESDDINDGSSGYLDDESKSRIMRGSLTTSITSSISVPKNNNRNSFNSTISNLTIKEELRKANVKFYI